MRGSNLVVEVGSPFGAQGVYISVASRRLRTRSSYVYLSIPPKSIVMAPVEILTCNSHMCDTLALQLSPLSLVLASDRAKKNTGPTLRYRRNQSVC